MTSRLRRALRVWDSRHRRGAATTAYAAYAAVLVVVVVVVPVARAVWLALVDPATVAFLVSSSGPEAVTAVVSLLWAALIVAGRFLGPAVLSPVLAFIAVGSDLPRARVFARPLRRALSIPVLVLLAASAACGTALVVAGVWSLGHCALFVAAGFLAGLISAVLWVVGQVFPRGAVIIGVGLAGGGAAALLWPAFGVVVPAAWVGLVFSDSGGWVAVVGLAALAVVLISIVPVLLERLTVDDVLQQSVRREATVDHAAVLQLGELSALYQAKPTAGRFRRAVRVGRPTLCTFFLADLIGATRTPGRLLAAFAGTIGAGVLLAAAVVLPGGAGVVWGTAGGLMLFAAIGPLTDGIRHAAAATSERSIYGVSDGLLLFAHLTMPFAVMTALLLLAVAVTSAVFAAPFVDCALIVVSVGAIAIGTRIGNALKGSMPLSLLAAVPTPFGDPMALVRVAWAVDGLLLVGVAGASAGAGASAAVFLFGVAAMAAVVGFARWRRRSH